MHCGIDEPRYPVEAQRPTLSENGGQNGVETVMLQRHSREQYESGVDMLTTDTVRH